MGWRSALVQGLVVAAALCAGCNDSDIAGVRKQTVPTPVVPPEQQAPFAVIECNSFFTPGETAVFNGSHSWDPDGEIVSYEWSIESPAGSTSTLITNAGLAGFLVDVVGNYFIRLTVTDDDGLQAQAVVSFGGAPALGLRVELTWPDTYGQVDLDAHLVSGGGSFNSLTTDCFWYNCIPNSIGAPPDWGAAGDTSDDPGLDGDNIDQFVPENVVIDFPTDGTYRYIVYYYPREGADLPSTMTVNVFAGTVQVWTMNKTLAADKDLWTAADIVWNGGVATVQVIDTVDSNVE